MKKDSIVNICIASDDNYAPLVATTIASVCTNTSRMVKFWCLETNISKYNKRLIDSLHDKFQNFEIEYLTIDRALIDDFANKLSTSGHISADTYSRLFIPDLFPNMEKMIYLDVDLIAVGDVGELYDYDLGKYALGAVAADYGVDKSQWFQDMEMHGAHQYFNAGVLLMNPKELYNDKFLDKISKIANKYGQYIVLGDQDLLNKCFDANYCELPWRFNLTTRFLEMELGHVDHAHREQMANEYKNAVIRHFESRRKPWNYERNDCNGAQIKNMADFWSVAQMTPYVAWFRTQFEFSKMNAVQGNIWHYVNDAKSVMAVPHKTTSRFLLFDVIPFVRIRRRPKKTTYLLFGFLPIISKKLKNYGKKTVWRLFDLITVFSVK